MGRFKKAVREKLKLRLGLDGPPGSGKSMTALRFAMALAGPDGRVGAIDTEFRSLSKYEGLAPDGIPFAFDVCELERFSPDDYAGAIAESIHAGHDVLVIDSLSHAWDGVGGALDQIDRARDANRFAAWKDVTPKHRRMVDAILRYPGHVIVTMRTKTEYVLEANERGKMVPRKIGLKPVQRDGLEYEFDVFGDMDADHTLTITKSRCPAVTDAVAGKPGAAWLAPIRLWLDAGAEPAPPPPPPAFAPVPTQANGHGEALKAFVGQVREIGRFLHERGYDDSPDAVNVMLKARAKNKGWPEHPGSWPDGELGPALEEARRYARSREGSHSDAYRDAVTLLLEAGDVGELEAVTAALKERKPGDFNPGEQDKLWSLIDDRQQMFNEIEGASGSSGTPDHE